MTDEAVSVNSNKSLPPNRGMHKGIVGESSAEIYHEGFMNSKQNRQIVKQTSSSKMPK
jgi:hypothetical protein